MKTHAQVENALKDLLVIMERSAIPMTMLKTRQRQKMRVYTKHLHMTFHALCWVLENSDAPELPQEGIDDSITRYEQFVAVFEDFGDPEHLQKAFVDSMIKKLEKNDAG